ncbi:hypothetical protein DRP53_05960 [candidate division WOR-3 bacterium]|uniref:HVO-0234-like beta-propeller domain-containing protein n=1 Tax=candidate division WOR-3 bacterium TaxID=2052148 RepID=A0A660SH69_UNCW3|nr:MAG: hypothetical protein DRP53_05960 [candidate division WOR-3 bacterium]
MTVAKTTNGGTSWSRYHLTTTSGFCYALAVDPTTSSIVYAGGQGGLYKTTSGGSSWSKITGSISGTVYDIAIDPGNHDLVYVAAGGGVYKSTDGGSSWNNLGLSSATAVVIDPNDPEVIYAGTSSGVYKSTSGGGNWVQMNEGLTEKDVTALDIDPGDYLFCGTDGASMFRWSLSGPEVSSRGSSWVTFRWVTPVRDRVEVTYQLKRAGWVELLLYDVSGRRLVRLDSGYRGPGLYRVNYPGRLAPGVYFLRFNHPLGSRIGKLVVMR